MVHILGSSACQGTENQPCQVEASQVLLEYAECPQNDELCRLPLLRTHFHAVNPFAV